VEPIPQETQFDFFINMPGVVEHERSLRGTWGVAEKIFQKYFKIFI
jgi:hypothetical protein